MSSRAKGAGERRHLELAGPSRHSGRAQIAKMRTMHSLTTIRHTDKSIESLQSLLKQQGFKNADQIVIRCRELMQQHGERHIQVSEDLQKEFRWSDDEKDKFYKAQLQFSDKKEVVKLNQQTALLERALREKQFENPQEIAEKYREMVEDEEYDEETLLFELRDPGGSILVEQLQTNFKWNQENANFFQKLLLRLIESEKENMRHLAEQKEVAKSLSQKNLSPEFAKAHAASTKIAKKTEMHPMPVYLNRAIFGSSVDESLEQLLDEAVKKVLQSPDWTDAAFVADLYSTDGFERSVKTIFDGQVALDFFTDFIKSKYQRQIRLHLLAEQEEKASATGAHPDDMSQTSNHDEDHSHISEFVVYYTRKASSSSNDRERKEQNDEKKDEDEAKEHEYHIFPSDMPPAAGANFNKIDSLGTTAETTPADYDWLWWKHKRKGVVTTAAANGIKTYGYWEVLNNEKHLQKNITTNGVSVEHLNIVLALLRHYYRKHIAEDRLPQPQASSPRAGDPTVLHTTYCDGKFIPVKLNAHIHIHSKSADTARTLVTLLELTWWNNATHTACNCLAIKNKTAMLEKDYDQKEHGKKIEKEKYYMRINTAKFDDKKDDDGQTIDDEQRIDWQWYDNDNAKYETFLDFKNVSDEQNRHKRNLLKKQLDATFFSNDDRNYPWKLFDSEQPEQGHSFNNALIMHLIPALADRGISISTKGYVARFSRLYHKWNAGNQEKATTSLNRIVNMEQVAISSDTNTFSRNIRRLKGGRNSLKLMHESSSYVINNWLQKYLLFTDQQQKYFWAYILAICTQIKHREIELESQFVNIANYESFLPGNNTDTSHFDETGITEEKNNAQAYKGWVVAPVLDSETSSESSHTVILRKVYENDRVSWYDPEKDGARDDPYSDSAAVMLRFAELVRKFVLESRFLSNDNMLWPYYTNYFHRGHSGVYQALINRFNLSLMYNRVDIEKLSRELDAKGRRDDNNDPKPERGFCCCGSARDSEDLEQTNTKKQAIRHKRKIVAQQMLLQKWETLRYLNILKSVINSLLAAVLERTEEQIKVEMQKSQAGKTMPSENRKNVVCAEIASYDDLKWEEIISQLDDSDRLQSKSFEVSEQQQPFFQSFMDCFALEQTDMARRKTTRILDPNETGYNGDNIWFEQFKAEWRAVPEWWSSPHDIVLFELALKYGDQWGEYHRELQGHNASLYKRRFTIDRVAQTGSANQNESQRALTYFDFLRWLKQGANILRRLKYLTQLLMSNLCKVKPSLRSIVLQKSETEACAEDQKFDDAFVLFSSYEKNKHVQFVRMQPKNPQQQAKQTGEMQHFSDATQLTVIEETENEQSENFNDRNDVMNVESQNDREASRENNDGDEKHFEQSGFSGGDDAGNSQRGRKKRGRSTSDAVEYVKKTDEEDSDDEKENTMVPIGGINNGDKDAQIKHLHDPFLERNLVKELKEVVHMFDVMTYGPYMARFIIDEISQYNYLEFWPALSVVMEALPFNTGLGILYDEMTKLRRAEPDRLFEVCEEMVKGTNFGVAASLWMADYFEQIAKTDNFGHKQWREKSDEFEKMGHATINNVESDHLLYILLTIPTSDTAKPLSILSLALEHHRISFLNNARILGITRHIWYHGQSIDVKDTIDTGERKWIDSFNKLRRHPFEFYFSPFGFAWTESMLYFVYLIYVLCYSYFMIKGITDFVADIAFWSCNAGFILYELNEAFDKGRQYFSVTGNQSAIVNSLDILTSLLWIVLFSLLLCYRDDWHMLLEFENDDEQEAPILLVGTRNSREAYSFLYAIQLFLLSIRFLLHFKHTKYLGKLLRIVENMSLQIAKFLCVAAVIISAFMFGLYFILGFNNLSAIDNELDEDDDGLDFWKAAVITFTDFLTGGTGSEEHQLYVVVPVFSMFITVFGFLVLTNLLIAMMTAEYESFEPTATAEVNFLWTETVLDIAHADRLMPPPLNLLAYVIGATLHFWFAVIPALVSLFWCCPSCCNPINCIMYTRIKGRRHCENDSVKGEKMYAGQEGKIYEDKWLSVLTFVGWMCCIRRFRRHCCWVSCGGLCCGVKRANSGSKKQHCVQCVDRWRGCCRKCAGFDDDGMADSLTAYHKACYNCIKLRVKESRHEEYKTVLGGISMMQYIERFEHARKTKLEKEDKLRLKHLTVNTLFCDQCFQPYSEKNVNTQLVQGIRVMLDKISCWIFLFIVWPPSLIFFGFMSLLERVRKKCTKLLRTNVQATDVDAYEREVYPHTFE